MARFSVALSLFCFEVACLVALSTADLCTRDGSYRRDYPGDCSKYVECVHGRSTVESCGWFHRFDEATNQCQFHFFGSVDCSAHNPTEKPILAPTKASDVAVNLADDQICTQDGTYKTYYPGNCDMYYNCDHGKATAGSCGWFYRFDEKSAECKYHWLFIGSVDCSKALSPTKKPSTPTDKPTTSSGSSKPTKEPIVTSTSKGPTDTPTTKSTSSTAPPNSATTKKQNNGAGSVEISMILATLCSFITFFRHLH